MESIISKYLRPLVRTQSRILVVCPDAGFDFLLHPLVDVQPENLYQSLDAAQKENRKLSLTYWAS